MLALEPTQCAVLEFGSFAAACLRVQQKYHDCKVSSMQACSTLALYRKSRVSACDACVCVLLVICSLLEPVVMCSLITNGHPCLSTVLHSVARSSTYRIQLTATPDFKATRNVPCTRHQMLGVVVLGADKARSRLSRNRSHLTKVYLARYERTCLFLCLVKSRHRVHLCSQTLTTSHVVTR